MASHRVRARPPRGRRVAPPVIADPDRLAQHLEDAAHFPGGYAVGLAEPADEAQVAALVTEGRAVLAIGAQSSLTGGATPRGELLISLRRFREAAILGRERVRAGAGLSVAALQQALDAEGLYYPPVPTWTDATVGGVVSTNAAGPATFKYGSTRDWVECLTVVLPSGDVLDLERGQCVAGPGGFEIETTRGLVAVPVPRVQMPPVPKRSAGYYGAPGMDLVDLFVGAEGTLGIVTEATLRVVARPPASVCALLGAASVSQALALVGALRTASHETRRSGDPNGLDLAAIEHLDRRSLDLLIEDGVDRREQVIIPPRWSVLLLMTLELRTRDSGETAWRLVESALDGDAPDHALVRLCRLLDAHDALDAAELALPGQEHRVAQWTALREGVPAAVNARIARARERLGPAVSKIAADVIVPFPRLQELLEACASAASARDLDVAIWGHISDGNLHPNVLPRVPGDVARGQEAVMEIGRATIALDGCPLAEHGVGRNPMKKSLLRLLHGDEGVETMRAVKKALDPEGRLAPGVLL
jgi:D-lactate dehydrogenase (cytochrome)